MVLCDSDTDKFKSDYKEKFIIEKVIYEEEDIEIKIIKEIRLTDYEGL